MLGDIYLSKTALTRSISAENRTGGKGRGGMAVTGTGEHAARELGRGWKISPSIRIRAGETALLGQAEGSGIINHIWLTIGSKSPAVLRRFILRIYWDSAENPAVECPVGDFFASANPDFWQVSSLAVCRNPRSGYNCYWPMPFHGGFRITAENLDDTDLTLYYQIDYELTGLPAGALYFHARFSRTNPLPYGEVYTILQRICGRGNYVGTYMVWGVNSNGWWGEGEIKFYMDGDTEFPTICGTGTEDYFCGSYNFDVNGQYLPFSSPYSGFYPWPTDATYKSQKRFSMYRWHLFDPIRFEEDLRVTIQALGWRPGKEPRYLLLRDDISSVAYFYLDSAEGTPSRLPSADELDII